LKTCVLPFLPLPCCGCNVEVDPYVDVEVDSYVEVDPYVDVDVDVDPIDVDVDPIDVDVDPIDVEVDPMLILMLRLIQC